MARRPRSSTTRRRRLPLTLALLILALLSIGIWWAVMLGPRVDPDQRTLRFERARRLALATAGRPLAGTPDLDRLPQRLAAHGVALGAPIFIRIFKLEFELEVWLERDGRFHRFATYPICRFSGWLGPKRKEGDRQSPEGFYTVDRSQLNPRSRWHRSFNLGFPNVLDRHHGRTGSFLMVHGGCSSIGCYAMTDAVIDELWRLVTAALDQGQPRFHVHVFPFRMDAAALDSRAANPDHRFWRDLREGYEAFETTQLVPAIDVCDGRYRIAPARDGSGRSRSITQACGAPTHSKAAARR